MSVKNGLDQYLKEKYKVEDIKYKEIIYLEITSWAGISLGAIHYYGKLKQSHNLCLKSIEIQKKVTQKEADYINKKDRFANYKAGYLTDRMDSKQEVIDLAIKLCKKQYPQFKVIVIGKSYIVQPQKVIFGPINFKTKTNYLYKELRKCYDEEGPDIRGNKRVKEICEIWESYFKWYKE